MVLVHGITESSETWAPITELLATRHRVVTLDLRGHGRSGEAGDYGLESMASDVISVVEAAEVDSPHIVGHSLGGVVASAVGAAGIGASVTCVDQSLQLGTFTTQLAAAEPMLRDPETFPGVMTALFTDMAGTKLSAAEVTRISELRRLDQEVVLGVWELVLTTPPDELAAVVDQVLLGYGANATPYLGVFGIDPGDDYGDWISSRVPRATVELWPGHGHYPHLVDPNRFVDRLETFWAQIP